MPSEHFHTGGIYKHNINVSSKYDQVGKADKSENFSAILKKIGC